jgi:hypothetical protein
MKRQAMAEWRGDLKTESGVLDKTCDSFTTRFGHPISVTNSLRCIRSEHISSAEIVASVIGVIEFKLTVFLSSSTIRISLAVTISQLS